MNDATNTPEVISKEEFFMRAYRLMNELVIEIKRLRIAIDDLQCVIGE